MNNAQEEENIIDRVMDGPFPAEEDDEPDEVDEEEDEEEDEVEDNPEEGVQENNANVNENENAADNEENEHENDNVPNPPPNEENEDGVIDGGLVSEISEYTAEQKRSSAFMVSVFLLYQDGSLLNIYISIIRCSEKVTL